MTYKMTRQTAYQILTKHLKNPILLQHSFAVEAVMQALAPRYNGDVEEWAVTGLLHDADYEKTKGHPEKHGLLLSELEPNTIPTTIEYAIQAHNSEETHVIAQSPMDWALICADKLSAFIQELLREQKEKNAPALTTELILQKLHDKNSYKDVKKEHIFLCEEKLGIPLADFVAITLSAIQGISSSLQS